MLHKTVFVVRPGHSIDELATELRAKGARPIQLFPPTAIIADAPAKLALNGGDELPAQGAQPNDAATRTALSVLQALTQQAAPAANEGLSWDSPGKKAPRDRVRLRTALLPQPLASAPAASGIALSTGTPSSRFLVGRVAVALVIVSRTRGTRPAAPAEFLTQAERDTAATEAAQAFAWLATLEPRAGVEFVVERHDVEIGVAPNPLTADTFEARESVWRDPALRDLGYASGPAGYKDLAEEVRDRNGARWGFVLFITRYPLHHFAYASAERVVQHYDNDGWGTADLNRVIAHETCHIFGALDEYSSSGCSCTETGGELQVENGNCRNCAPASVPCLMDANTLAMCTFSRGQIGWRAPLLPWNFLLQTGTALHLTDPTFQLFMADYDGNGIPDLVAIKKSATGTGTTEVHVYSGADQFQTPLVQTGTGLHPTDHTFWFALLDWDRDGLLDLVAVKKSGTGSGMTEVHIFSGASGFKTPILQVPTGLHQTDDTFEFAFADWDRDGIPDLVAIKKSRTGTGTTEVHIFSGASNFQTPILQTGTALHETDQTFTFLCTDWDRDGLPDLLAVKRSGTGTQSTEVHILSGSANFQAFIEQSATALHETDQTFDFDCMDVDGDGQVELIAIKKQNTGTGTTEVHALKR